METSNRLTTISTSGSTNGETTGGSHVFHGYELLLLRKLDVDPSLADQWKEKLMNKAADDGYDIGEIPHHLWFLAVTLDRKKDRFLTFLQEQLHMNLTARNFRCRETLMTRYMSCHIFTELHLDGIFKYGDDNTLPLEIFRCTSVRWLSMKYNYLDRIPCDIGRMYNLEYLALTNNKLQNKSLPYSLIFCTKLHTLMLDNNLLDALPGFLLKMASLETVHRHGNHNYFKSTFMWYHTDVNERILAVPATAGLAVGDYSTITRRSRKPESLQFWAAKAIVASKINFFADPSVAPALKDYIADIYRLFNVCGFCNVAKLATQSGFKVITFKNPYLGNTCVPFQHWACSLSCAMALEIPAREEQISAARELDRQYDAYVRDCQRQYEQASTCCGTTARRRLSRKHGMSRHSSRSSSLSTQPSSYQHVESSVQYGSVATVAASETNQLRPEENCQRGSASLICCCLKRR